MSKALLKNLTSFAQGRIQDFSDGGAAGPGAGIFPGEGGGILGEKQRRSQGGGHRGHGPLLEVQKFYFVSEILLFLFERAPSEK